MSDGDWVPGRYERWTYEYSLKIGRFHAYPSKGRVRPKVLRLRAPALDYIGLRLPFVEVFWIQKEV